GAVLAEKNIEVIYGGGNVGLMGALARTVLRHGGRVTGIIPRKIYDNVSHIELSDLIIVETMHERKAKLYDSGDAFLALPG
ncbi:LOG family protein, partial [Staphylococcus sp. SIMBA_130]